MRCQIGYRVNGSCIDRSEESESVMMRKFAMGLSWGRVVRHWYMAVSSAVETETRLGSRYD